MQCCDVCSKRMNSTARSPKNKTNIKIRDYIVVARTLAICWLLWIVYTQKIVAVSEDAPGGETNEDDRCVKLTMSRNAAEVLIRDRLNVHQHTVILIHKTLTGNSYFISCCKEYQLG